MNLFRRSNLQAIRDLALIWMWVAAASILGLRLGNRWILPVLQTFPVYLGMLWWLHHHRRMHALAMMLGWAAALAVVMAVLVQHDPQRAAGVILHGSAYRKMMFHWLCTGVGMESTPRLFIPAHLREIVLFSLSAGFTAGLVAMHGGAVLMNYMSYYVGSLMHAADHPWLVFFIGWKIYAVIRVIAFVILGVHLAEPLWFRITGRTYEFRNRRAWFLAAAAGLGLDILLKTLTAPAYQKLLSHLVHLSC